MAVSEKSQGFPNGHPFLLALLTFSIGAMVLAILCAGLAMAYESPGRAVFRLQPFAPQVGDAIDMWRGVPVRFNGTPYWRSLGSHSAPDGYYYGRQWQCVEFVKRFYHDAHGHWMPDVMGNACEFFDTALPDGALNQKRGMWQYVNGGTVAPRVDDLFVWTDNTYGHVAVVSKVGPHFVEVVQQNTASGSRARLALEEKEGRWFVRGNRSPAGWLRLPEKSEKAPE